MWQTPPDSIPESEEIAANGNWRPFFIWGLICFIGVLLFASWSSLTFVMSLFTAASAVVTQVAPTPVEPPRPALIIPEFLAKFKDHLMTVSWGQATAFDYTKLSGVDYIAFYYSASWCPPCRAFTPRLVSFYNSFKPHHPNFELIFVNHDQNEADMLSYMRGDGMPWPAIWFSDLDNSELNANEHCGPGIPSLCLLDNRGIFLAGSYDGSDNYIPPDMILDEIRRRVP